MRFVKTWLQTLLCFSGRFTVGGIALAIAEMLLAGSENYRLSLPYKEIWYSCFFILSALVTASLICASVGAVVIYLVQIRSARNNYQGVSRRIAFTAALASAPFAGLILWLLTNGRRIRDLPGRPLLVIVAALLLSLFAFWLSRTLIEITRDDNARQRIWASVSLAVIAISFLLVDAWVLRRLYPPFHWALTVIALCSITSAVALMPFGGIASFGVQMTLGVLGLTLIVFAPIATTRLLDTSRGGMAVERSAPVSGKLLSLASRLLPSKDENRNTGIKYVEEKPRREAPVQKGIDLRNRDVLLVTVDALRADRLSAYGGGGLTPKMDALSRESVVFLRTYTPTPLTSYALASMLTGKFLKPVMELFPEDHSHPTVASLLRRYGYFTAAFYPPAVFYIDQNKFKSFRNNHFGFEYLKEDFTAAYERVQQVAAFLEEAGSERPLFVWVHFFEPHEPYEPPPEFTRGQTPEALYDGEVAAADDAVGKLVTAFRAAKPNAIVIVAADHGEAFGEHGGYYHGTTLYDEQVRVPFIWSTPAAVKPGEVQRPVELVDIAVTLLSVLGIPRHAGMHGDDLSSLLRGSDSMSDGYAFSEINDQRMVSDGRYKAICTVGQNHCRLFDLASDPSETRSLHDQRPEIISNLRAALAGFIASIPKRQAASTQNNQRWTEIFSRAKLGDPTVGSDLVPLIGSQSAQVRRAAVRFCGELNYLPAVPIVSRLSVEDSDESVRAESAIAAVCFGQESARAQAEQFLTLANGSSDPDQIDRSRRAALCLAKPGYRKGLHVLIDLAGDRSASRSARKRAIAALGVIGEERAVRPLIDLLADDLLRIEAASALGDIGGKDAANALVRALKKERYLVARQTEARALVRLKDRRVKALIRRYLGTDGSLPGGVDLLLSMGALDWVSGQGADLRRNEKARRGQWDCSRVGCRPDRDAEIVLPAKRAPEDPVRAVFRLVARSDSETLRIGDQAAHLRTGEQEVGFSLPTKNGSRLIRVSSSSGVRLVAVVVVSDLSGKEGPS